MIRTSLKLALIAAAAVVTSSSMALAAPAAWDMPAGDHGSYTYSSGQSTTGHIGSGSAYSDGFFFIPPSLKAVATASNIPTAFVPAVGHDESSDTVSVILNAKPNAQFTRITSGLLGDFTMFGTGAVNSTGELRVVNLDTSTTLTSPLAFGGTVPAVAVDGSNDGIFNGVAAIDLPAGWTNIRVEMDGFVSADALGGSSLIQAKDAEIGVQTSEIPIPAAFAVAPVAAFVGWRARRKLALAK